jgi:hypothetical protein
MSGPTLRLTSDQYAALIRHLLPAREQVSEQAAFAFAQPLATSPDLLLSVTEYHIVPAHAFAYQSGYHIELSDETRAFVIKRAHDLKCSLVEFHSHLGSRPAQFSMSDFTGFSEFVPHVWWRLRGRPYVAVVVAGSGFDALAWVRDAQTPEPVMEMEVGAKRLRPTGLSWHSLDRGSAWTA